MTLIEEIDIINKKYNMRQWILGELRTFESRYGMETNEFAEKWIAREIPEPNDQNLLEDFLEWQGLYESLAKVDEELKAIEKRIKES